MEINDIVFKEDAYNRIGAVLDENFGEIDVKTLTDETLAIFLAAAIKISYQIGYYDGAQSIVEKK